MKKYIMTMLLLFMGATFCACGSNNSDATNANDQQGTSVEQTESSVEKDSMALANKAVLDSIANLHSNIDKVNSDFTRKSTEMDEEVSSLRCMVWALGGFCVLCLLLSFIVIMWCRKLREQGIQHREDIKNLSRRVGNGNVAASSVVGKPSNEYYELRSKVAILEDEIRRINRIGVPTPSSQQPKSNPNHTPNNVGVSSPKEEKVVKAYFGNPTMGDKDGYFKKVLDSRDSDARFVAEISGDKASFKPLTDSEAAKKTLLTSDQMKLAVEFSGCSLSEMKGMEITAGYVEKKENGRWVIKNKARVILK
ncbi:MAG: hypothetical protein HDS97_08655 [Bacteroidales bacterium]|nr:hypothetical protein [Bacteroidales bacterium]